MPAGVIALGLVQGSLAALNSLGLVLLWRTTRVVNLAQPAMGLVGGVLTGLLVVSGGWSFWWAAPVGLGIGSLMGLGAERLILSRLQDKPRAVLLVATVGLAQVFGALQAALPFAFDGPLPTYQLDLGLTLDLGPVRLLGAHLLVLGVMPVAVFGLYRFLHHSRLGLAACALGQDAERARALGVPAGTVRAVVWAVAGFLSALYGILAIPVLGFNLGGGLSPTVLLFALTPAVLAGLRSLPGAAAGALGLGVAYQACLWFTKRGGIAELLLAGSVVAAVALQRRRIGREETAARASSWEAATTPRPLPWWVSSSRRVRIAASVLAVAALIAAALPPRLLSPGNDVLYSTSSALVIGGLAVAVAWMFAGEIVLGHWGLAGLGAVVAALVPGPWPVRCGVAAFALAISGAALSAASRRPSTLSFTVLGLAAAAAAPVAILLAGRGSVPADPAIVGSVGAVLAVAATIVVTKLRWSMWGARLVAARDEPERAPWLGVVPAPARAAALALSGGLAGLAGALYLASTPAGIAPGAFEPGVSLVLLAMGVVGGLGSAVGVLAGGAALQAARLTLPGPWALLATGTGVLVVVLFLPAGLSRAVVWARDLAVRLLEGRLVGGSAAVGMAALAPVDRRLASLSPRTPRTTEGRASRLGWSAADGDGSRIAGSDTRDAASTPTVRLASIAAALAAAPGWAAVLGGSRAWDRWLEMPSWAGAWFTVALAALGAAVATVSRRWPLPSELGKKSERDLPAGTGAALTIALLGVVVAASGDSGLGALALPAVVSLGGWVAGRAARLAARTSVPASRAAAAGLVTVAALVGVLPAGHLLLVGSSSGLARAGAWSAAYAGLAALWLIRADRAMPADRTRLRSRVVSAAGTSPPADLAMALQGISVTFGAAAVLRNASLAARSGELTALVGANGSGKSTLLRVAAGLVIPDSGRVVVAREDFTTLRPEERAAAGLAFVSGARPAFPDLSVLENLRVAAFRSHATSRSFGAATDAVLELVPALAHRRNAKVGVLSGGEQRLLAVAQTLYRRPVVLLADELTLGLDVEAREAVMEVLRLLADEGVAVVAVDHDLPALLPRANRAALLVDGEVREYAKPEQLLERRTKLLPASFLAGVAG